MGDVDSKRVQDDQKDDSALADSLKEEQKSRDSGEDIDIPQTSNAEEKETIEPKTITVDKQQSAQNSEDEVLTESIKLSEDLTGNVNEIEGIKDTDNINITKQTASECGDGGQLIIDRNSCSDEQVSTKEKTGLEYVVSFTSDVGEGSLNESTDIEMGNQQPGKHKKTGKGNVNKQTALTTHKDKNADISGESLPETAGDTEKVDTMPLQFENEQQDTAGNDSTDSKTDDSDENEEVEEDAYSDEMFDELDNEEPSAGGESAEEENGREKEQEEENFINKLSLLADELVGDMLEEEMKNVYLLKMYDSKIVTRGNESSTHCEESPKSFPTVNEEKTSNDKSQELNSVDLSLPIAELSIDAAQAGSSSDIFELNMENKLNECGVELVLSPDTDVSSITATTITEEMTEEVKTDNIPDSKVESNESVSETVVNDDESTDEEASEITEKSQENEENSPITTSQVTDQTSTEAILVTKNVVDPETEQELSQCDKISVENDGVELRSSELYQDEEIAEDESKHSDVAPVLEPATDSVTFSDNYVSTEKDENKAGLDISQNDSAKESEEDLEEPIVPCESEVNLNLDTAIADDSTASGNKETNRADSEEIVRERDEQITNISQNDSAEECGKDLDERIVPCEGEVSLNLDTAIADDSTASGSEETNEADSEEIVREIDEQITEHGGSVDIASEEHEDTSMHKDGVESMAESLTVQILNDIIESIPIPLESTDEVIGQTENIIDNTCTENFDKESDFEVQCVVNPIQTENDVDSEQSKEEPGQHQSAESGPVEVAKTEHDEPVRTEESTLPKDAKDVENDQDDLVVAIDEVSATDKVDDNHVIDKDTGSPSLVAHEQIDGEEVTEGYNISDEPRICDETEVQSGESSESIKVIEEPHNTISADSSDDVTNNSEKEAEKSDAILHSVIDIVDGTSTMEIVCAACGNLLHINTSVEEFPTSQNESDCIVRCLDDETPIVKDERNSLDDLQEDITVSNTDRESERIERLAGKGEKLLKMKQQMEKESLKWKLKPESNSLPEPSTYDGLSSISMLSRGSSDDTSGSEPTAKELKDALAELEEKYKQAMVQNAQLDNERAQLNYRVEQLKDTMEEQEEELYRVKAKFKEKCQGLEKDKRMYNVLMRKHEDLQEVLRQRDELIQEQGLVVVGGNGVVMGDSDDGECVDGGRQYALVTPEAAQVLQSAGDGSLDVQLKNLAEEKRDLFEEVQRLRSELEEVRQGEDSKGGKSASSMYPENGAAIDMQLLEIQREAGKQISEYKFKLQKAEQEIGAFQSNVSRLETQLQRYKATSEVLEKSEDEMRAEKRKLQRDLRASLDRIEEMEMTNAHLEKRLERLRANRAQNTQS